jgi:hypothetical protein
MAGRDDRKTQATGDFPRPEDLDARFRQGARAILDKINSQVAAGDSIEQILGFVFNETRGIMPCDRIGLALLEEGGRRAAAHVALASYAPLYLNKGYSADVETTSLGRVLKTGEPRIISNLEAYALAHPHSETTRLLLREGVRSSMTCPLLVNGRPLGFLFRSSRFPNAYSEREVALHLRMAERLGQAVEKAWRIEQLEATTKAYTQMLSFVAHELKNPLASIISEGRVMQEGYLGELSPKQGDMLGKMVRKAEYLLGLTRDYLDLARIESGELKLSPLQHVDIEKDVVALAEELVRPQIEERGMRLEREGSAPSEVECDPSLITIAVTNLLGNAAKYGNEGGRIVLGSSECAAGFRLWVFNEGPGFPESQKRDLFRRFSRLKTPELVKRRGTGVGLYNCWHIVQLHGGRIWAESVEGLWAKFTLEIPQPLQAPAD